MSRGEEAGKGRDGRQWMASKGEGSRDGEGHITWGGWDRWMGVKE